MTKAYVIAILLFSLHTIHAFSSSPIDGGVSASNLDVATQLLSDQLLDLTSDQIAKVHQSLSNYDNIDIDANLSWINSRLSLNNDRTQLTAIVVGHPPILGYDIKKRLEPAITFYEDALQSCANDDDDTDADNNTIDRLVSLLCKSPQLLEYNVKKRLVPRLERVLGKQIQIDEDILKIIATKTDSRFDEWMLDNTISGGNKTRDNGEQCDTTIQQQHHEDDQGRQPPSYIVLSNLQSGSNIGNILRSASIFGCKELIVVGQKRYRLTGDHGSRFDLQRHHVYSHLEAKAYLQSKDVRVYGVEIIKDAKPIMQYDQDTGIMQFPFKRQYQGGAAFLMGNEGEGLSSKQKEICDEFIFVPQTRGGSVGGGGSASLNVACAATVILQAYCVWAGYPVAQRDGGKFVASIGKSEQL